VADEALRVRVLRAVVGVRVDDQLSVGDVLLQNPGVDGVDDHVVVTVDYQRRLQAKTATGVPREDRPLTGRGANLRARTGSVSGVTAVDVEDVAGDE
jgi:hypothetical protein